jgi:predicted small secreted protein
LTLDEISFSDEILEDLFGVNEEALVAAILLIPTLIDDAILKKQKTLKIIDLQFVKKLPLNGLLILVLQFCQTINNANINLLILI